LGSGVIAPHPSHFSLGDRRLGRPQRRSGCSGKRKIPSLPLPEIKLVFQPAA